MRIVEPAVSNHLKPILVILHRSCGEMGNVGEMLLRWGYRLDIRCIIEGDTLPNAADYAAVVVFGGVMSANDAGRVEGIAKEKAWIPCVIETNVPYLGICLGAQLLANALGAGVVPKADRSVEIGFHKIRPKKPGDLGLPAAGLRFYQWHLEGFEVPPNCQCLAESDHFNNQAFRLNAHTFGLQFHPETTREMIDCWVQREPQHLSLVGAQSYKMQVELFKVCEQPIKTWLQSFLSAWLLSDTRDIASAK